MDGYLDLDSLRRYWMMEEEDDDTDFLFDDDEAEAATYNHLVEAESSRTRRRSDAPPKADATAAKEKRGSMKPVPVSEEMRRFAGGTPEVARTQAVKLIWAHIKANGLQNPAEKTEINCDATLKSLFGGRDKVGMLEIMKLINPHFPKN